MSLAAQLLDAVGGPDNIAALTHCWARLRFTLRDDGALDESRILATPDVAMAVHQRGEYHIVLKGRLLETFDDLTTLITKHQEVHHG